MTPYDKIRAALESAIKHQSFAELNAVWPELAELAAAVAERDARIAELELRLSISRQSNKELRESAERAEARLAAIDNAPTVAWLCTSESGGAVDATPRESVRAAYAGFGRAIEELIARPAKE